MFIDLFIGETDYEKTIGHRKYMIDLRVLRFVLQDAFDGLCVNIRLIDFELSEQIE
jgi:hypothetical protein